MENQQYLQAFLDESYENTQALNEICLQIEQRAPTDEDFATMFRAAHTLKGMSATMGFERVAAMTHRMEDSLGYIRQNPAVMSPAVVDVLFAAIDALEGHLGSVRDFGTEVEVDDADLIGRLQAIVGGTPEAAATAAVKASRGSAGDGQLEASVANVALLCRKQGMLTGWLTVDLDPRCVMKGPRAIMVSRAIEEEAQVLQCTPPAEVMESGSFDANQLQFFVAVESSEERLIAAVDRVSEIAAIRFQPYTERPQESAIVVKPPAGVDKLKDTVAGRADRIDRTIRVPAERLDVLMNLLSELVIDKTRLESLTQSSGRPELKELSDHMSRIANELQSSVMSLRMVPVEMLFQRFPRMVRDLSKTLGKDIHLDMSGLETEFDRTVVDEMGEALVHLIRNSADHGLESPEERVRQGKPTTGTIYLRAYASGQNVFIEVADDGQGIDVERVRTRAVNKGLVSAEVAAGMSPHQVADLLFESGFSTAETVSDISGRGVGLDAVRSKVESLGGRIDLEWQPLQGSVFRIQLPLTLSILQALVVKVQGDVYAIPLGSVEEVMLAEESDLKVVHGNTFLQYRGQLLSIVDTGQWMYEVPSITAQGRRIVVCIEGNRKIALAVDEFLGRMEIVHKSLGDYLKSTKWFSGATILGDGSIALLVDIHSWMTLVLH